MVAFLIRRLLTTVITVVVAMTLYFVVIRLIPGDPATIILGPRATEGMIQAMRERMLLDHPFYVQLGQFLLNIARGDLGEDVLNFMPVRALIGQVLFHTIALATCMILVSSLIGIPLGAYAATNRNSLVDRITGVLSVSMITTPSFVAGLFLLLVFAIHLGWFPVIGSMDGGGLLGWLRQLVLPVAALSIQWVGYIARLVRAAVLEEMMRDYTRTAVAKGLPRSRIIYKHVLRNALVPVIAVLGVGFGNLLGGTVLVEIIFSRPGLGFLMYNAIEARNFPVVQGGLVVAVLLYSVANLLADLSYAIVDPRLRSQ